MKPFPLFLVFLAAALTGSCAKRPAADIQVLARVGASQILAADLQAEASRRSSGQPGELDKRALLDELIVREALYLKAVQSGLDRDPEIQRAWKNLLIGKLKERDLEPQLEETQVTPAQLAQAYHQRVAQFTQAPQCRLALLHLRTHPTMPRDKMNLLRARMEDARSKAANLNPESGFGTLAIDYSEDDATRYKGGDLGWLEVDPAKYRWNIQVLSAGFALENVGEISDVVETKNGLYLVKLTGRRAAEVLPLDTVRPSLVSQLIRQQRKQIELAFIEEVKSRAGVEVFSERLEALALAPVRQKLDHPLFANEH